MVSKQNANQYLNYLAQALAIIHTFPSYHNEIYTLKDFNIIFKKTNSILKDSFAKSHTEFLLFIKDFLENIEKDNSNSKFIKAVALVLFLDQKISYFENSSEGFPLTSLVKYSENKPAILWEPLNTNYKETCICINPKFEASLLYEADPSNDYDRRLFNRDAFWGMNSKLNNCSYFKMSEAVSVTNVIVPVNPLQNCLRLAFSPLLDKTDVLSTGLKNFSRNGTVYRGEYLKKLKYSTLIEQNFKAAWDLACKKNVNIFFAPEMLCTKKINKIKDNRNKFIAHISYEQMANGNATPYITVLPSCWDKGNNYCQILYQDGKLLGKQFKKYPYVNEKSNALEALKSTNDQEIIVLHIPGFHRIVIMICSDFLTEQEKWLENFICKQLQATLILVPSFSGGEQDFINSLPILKRYGTSVIWGNCCGAKIDGEKQIGGCGFVGIDNIQKFKDVCVCQPTCQGECGCIFVVDIPLKLNKDNHMKNVNVEHMIYCDKM